jgi:hypothetical protein
MSRTSYSKLTYFLSWRANPCTPGRFAERLFALPLKELAHPHLYEYLESAKVVASAGRAQLITAHWLARRPRAGTEAWSKTLPLRSAYTS